MATSTMKRISSKSSASEEKSKGGRPKGSVSRMAVYRTASDWQKGSMRCGALKYERIDASTLSARCTVTGGKCNYSKCPRVKKNQEKEQ